MRPPLCIFACLILWTNSSEAWSRRPIPDTELVQQSELIVVAHVKPESIVYVPHPIKDGGMSWEHHATLVITSVLKGAYSKREVPVIIHYGLDPKIVSNGVVHEFSQKDFKKYITPASVIALYNDPGEMSGEEIDNIGKDQLWFLRVLPDKGVKYEGDDSVHAPGIWDPEDVQQLELKPYFQAFIGGHPEVKLKEFIHGDSMLAARSRVYLDHLKIQEIAKEPDVEKRIDLLLPYFLFTDEKDAGPTQGEAGGELRKCGKPFAARLVSIFKDPKYAAMQPGIILLWGGMNYHEAVPLMIDLLKSDNDYWVKMPQAERDLWANRNATAPTEQGISRRRIEYVLISFKLLADPRTRPILEETMKIWEDPSLRQNFDHDCSEAIYAIQNEEAREQKSQ
ncbi:MAG TPA: hypothetical protein VG733_11445 [Chthoniobacteraceae bacterium]|nr:hypothetical protein [Chthoniobacteraceae bacterium]